MLPSSHGCFFLPSRSGSAGLLPCPLCLACHSHRPQRNGSHCKPTYSAPLLETVQCLPTWRMLACSGQCLWLPAGPSSACALSDAPGSVHLAELTAPHVTYPPIHIFLLGCSAWPPLCLCMLSPRPAPSDQTQFFLSASLSLVLPFLSSPQAFGYILIPNHVRSCLSPDRPFILVWQHHTIARVCR